MKLTEEQFEWQLNSLLRHPGPSPQPILHPRRYQQVINVLEGPDTEQRRELEYLMASIASNVKRWERRRAEYDRWIAENPRPT